MKKEERRGGGGGVGYEKEKRGVRNPSIDDKTLYVVGAPLSNWINLRQGNQIKCRNIPTHMH